MSAQIKARAGDPFNWASGGVSDAPMRVGVTGISSDLGRALLPLLERDAAVERIVAFDVARPGSLSKKVEVVRIDLTRPGIEKDLTQAMSDAKLDALFHLAFVNSKVHKAGFAHDLEVIGTSHVLTAVGEARVRRLVLPSLTVLYGAHTSGPTFLPERHPLEGCPGSRFITDRVEVEQRVKAFTELHPEIATQVLRFAPIVGPTSDNPLTRLLRTRFVPTILGFDPLWQVIHESDAARALHLALHSRAVGTFNIVGEGVMPLSALIRRSGAQAVPLPGPVLRSVLSVLEATGIASAPEALHDFFKFSWLADGRRAMQELGFYAQVSGNEAVVGAVPRGN